MTADLPLGLVLEIIVCVFLAATIGYCAILDRRLKAMRSGQDGLRDLIGQLNGATTRAVQAIDALKQASTATNDELGERVRRGGALAAELGMMIETGNNIAERLGRGERAGAQRPHLQPAAAPRTSPQPASQTLSGKHAPPNARDTATATRAAHQLLDALKRAR
ncbi:MAG: hypothetical protein CVT73_14055 [Alphaproteobacteria bacterium HGW-Alphaproteobacteria-12]|nr:MAG: hypothetical protein CVT73_14055 [Alphaproteobacteria bacterium HGW-Alphaproteobacteria-12]